jgi:hypothetical protein
MVRVEAREDDEGGKNHSALLALKKCAKPSALDDDLGCT